MNEEVDPALVVERLKAENALLKSELRFVGINMLHICKSRTGCQYNVTKRALVQAAPR